MAANADAVSSDRSEATHEITNNRPDAVAQQKLQNTVDNSPQVSQLKATQNRINASSQASETAQRASPTQQSAHAAPVIQNQAGNGDVAQLVGYAISGADDALAIDEQQVGSGASIAFTTFTSCIGVVGKKADGTLVGVHLVRFAKGGDPFTMDDVPTVNALTAGLSDLQIIGETDFWEMEILEAIGGTIVGGGTGNYSASTNDNGEIEISS